MFDCMLVVCLLFEQIKNIAFLFSFPYSARDCCACQCFLEIGPGSRAPGIFGSKFLHHLVSRIFLDKISVLLERVSLT